MLPLLTSISADSRYVRREGQLLSPRRQPFCRARVPRCSCCTTPTCDASERSVRSCYVAPRLLGEVQQMSERPAESPSRKSRFDLLERPAVAVWIAEGGERPVAGVIRCGTADPTTNAIAAELGSGSAGVEYLANRSCHGWRARPGPPGYRRRSSTDSAPNPAPILRSPCRIDRRAVDLREPHRHGNRQ